MPRRDGAPLVEPLDPRLTTPGGTRETQSASLPGPTSSQASDAGFGEGKRYRLIFSVGAAALDREARAQLDEIAAGLATDGLLRLQLLAYAGGSARSAGQSRRLSLSRALSVRSYLIDKGVRSTRIDVRALGNRFQDGPADRVDLLVTKR